MIWHIVRFDFSRVDDAERTRIEQMMRELVEIEEVAMLRVAHELADRHVTGLLTGFASREDLETYRTHAAHQPLLAAVRDAGVSAVRLDIETEDDPTELPRVLGAT